MAMAVLLGGLTASSTLAAPFSVGNLVVFSADTAASNNTSFTILEISGNGTGLVQSIPIPATGVSALRASGSATSTGYLSATADRSLVNFTAANTTTTGVNSNSIIPRGVGTVDANGTYNLATTYNGSSGNQPRSATSLDNSTWYIADQGGVYTNSSTSASPTANIRSIKPFGGSVYTLQNSSTVTNIMVSSVSAPSGGSITGLPGLTNSSAVQDFYLVASGSHGSTYDMLYVTTTTANAQLQKFSLDIGGTGNWLANGVYDAGGSLFGLAAAWNGTGTDLFATTGTGATAANSLSKLVDTAGWNTTINIASSTSLYTAAAGTTMKGVEFAPVAVPEPSMLALMGAGAVGLLVYRARRRS
jgi:hypothetical protein